MDSDFYRWRCPWVRGSRNNFAAPSQVLRERRVWDRRLEDRITPNEIDEDLAIAPEQKSKLPAKADTKTTREDVDR
jgi:hypothetical protein